MLSQRRVGRTGGRNGLTRADAVGLLAAGFIFIVMLGSCTPRARENGGTNCRAHLHSLGLAMAMWQSDHDEAWPRFYDPGRP